MADPVVENLILDLLEWLGKQDRTYEETMEAWRTSCPKLPVWEDATDRGLVSMDFAQGRNIVRITEAASPFSSSRVGLPITVRMRRVITEGRGPRQESNALERVGRYQRYIGYRMGHGLWARY